MSDQYSPTNPPRHLKRYACPYCKCSLALVQAQGCKSRYSNHQSKCMKKGWGTLHRPYQQENVSP